MASLIKLYCMENNNKGSEVTKMLLSARHYKLNKQAIN